MNANNYTHSFLVDATPEAIQTAINKVRAWWTINTDGRSEAAGGEFTVQFADVHRTTQRIAVMEPGKRIVWHVTESHLPWLKDHEEWKGTEIVFDIERLPEGTRLTFTHLGLTPQVECFDQCEKGWDYFIGTSLFKLITEGAGLPDTSERTHMDQIGHVHPTNA